jgi:hypothetical protein
VTDCRVEELADSRIAVVELVIHPGESDEFRFASISSQGRFHPLALRYVDVRIQITVEHQHRNFDVSGMMHRSKFVAVTVQRSMTRSRVADPRQAQAAPGAYPLGRDRPRRPRANRQTPSHRLQDYIAVQLRAPPTPTRWRQIKATHTSSYTSPELCQHV